MQYTRLSDSAAVDAIQVGRGGQDGFNLAEVDEFTALTSSQNGHDVEVGAVSAQTGDWITRDFVDTLVTVGPAEFETDYEWVVPV